MKRIKLIGKISTQLENREVPLCVVCKENPARERRKTCSRGCSKTYWKTYHQIPEVKAHRKVYMKAYRQRKKKEKKE